MQLAPNEVQLWSLDLQISPEQENIRFTWLSADERARVERLLSADERRRFIVARSSLRQILGFYLNCVPQEVNLGYTEAKKPFLLAPNDKALQFNVAHSREHAVFAFTLQHPLGVDIEKIKPVAYEALAKRYFNEREYASLLELTVEDRQEAFYRIWTGKEAIVKAAGKKLSMGIKSFTIPLTKESSLVEFAGLTWKLMPLMFIDDYAAALAMHPGVEKIHYLQWQQDHPVIKQSQILLG